MRIKLILAADPTDPLRRNDPFMPLSLPILAGSAPGHDYTFVDLLWEDDPRYDEPVDLVGISARASAEAASFRIADEFRRRGVKVVLGGPQPSGAPLAARAHADAVAIGEGENLWPIIVSDAQAGALRDFYVCSPRPFQPGPGFSVYQDFAFPELSSTKVTAVRSLFRKKYRFDTVFAMRGCPVNCDFCAVTRLFGSNYRQRPIDDVVAEIDSFAGYYYLLDDTVFGRPSTYDYYLELYARIATLPRRRYFIGQANLDAAADPKGREVIKAAARAGFIYAAVGIESINPATLVATGAIRKQGAASPGQALERITESIHFIQDQGIVISGWFVVGYPQDSIETFYRTARYCADMHLLPAIFHVKATAGTDLYDRLVSDGTLQPERLMNMGHATITDEQILGALGHCIGTGYSLAAILRRTFFYLRRFKSDRIHKAIFTTVLQFKLKGGLDVAHAGARL
jgi:radical SAM superfamily enzyme YgiQ (UPF0313 family)